MIEPRPTVEVDTTGADEAIARAQGALNEAQARRLETVEDIQALVVPADPDQPVRTVVLVDREIGFQREIRELTGCRGGTGVAADSAQAPDGSLVWSDPHARLTTPAPDPNDRITRLMCDPDGHITRGDCVITGPLDEDGDPTSLAWTTVRLLREVLG